MFADHTTLVQFLIEERRRHPSASGDLNGLILDVALACKAIANRVALGALGGVLGSADHTNVQGEVQQKLDVISNEHFLRATRVGWARRRNGVGGTGAALPAARAVPAREVSAGLRSPRRLVEYRHQPVRRQHLLHTAGTKPRDRPETGRLPAARLQAGVCRIRDLRPVDNARAERGYRRARIHPRSGAR